jgi:hypothetical protein
VLLCRLPTWLEANCSSSITMPLRQTSRLANSELISRPAPTSEFENATPNWTSFVSSCGLYFSRLEAQRGNL